MNKIVLSLLLAVGAVSAQTTSGGLNCLPSANLPLVHAEGVAERVGDLVLSCSGGSPGTIASGNFSVFLNTAITNKIDADHTVDVVLTIDTGSGPAPSAVAAKLVANNQVAFNGVSFTIPADGKVTLGVANLRANAAALPSASHQPIMANLAVNGLSQFSVQGSQFVVAQPITSLYSLVLTTLVCSQNGSPIPSSLTLQALLAEGSAYASARVTEGYVAAFQPRAGGRRQRDADHLALHRLSGGGTGLRAQRDRRFKRHRADVGRRFRVAGVGGVYTPGGQGSLLLIRVRDTDANGAGGTLAWTPASSSPIPFGSFADVGIGADGNGMAVYEVVDANPSAIENAQIPAFLGLAASGKSYYATTGQELRLGPVSDTDVASATAPVPRFLGVSGGNDCNLNGDCNGAYLPKLGAYLNPDPLSYVTVQGKLPQPKYLVVTNEGQGVLNWTAQAEYKTDSGWLTVSPGSGFREGSVRVDAIPTKLGPGTYEAS